MTTATLFLFVLAALCGGVGAVCRFLVDSAVNRHNRLRFPLGTIVVNVTACFLLGLLTGVVATFPALSDLKFVLGTGLLGGYSTFSTASVEGFRQIQAGHGVSALLHTGGMLILSLIAGFVGLIIG
ncbi:MAG: CrcB family protein [Bifidobacteriaceae bacterium]|jgi:CrcB protein|nr:CrcB family protein [Bifidobacteriaceae bacterium]MCI1979237.1 CrcB family protein [Bifidobacteriaceae bacterium]